MIGWSDGKNNYAPSRIVTVEDDVVFTAVYQGIDMPDSGSDSLVDSDEPITDSSPNSSSEESKNGCFGGVDAQTLVSIIVVLGAVFAVKRKREDK